MKIVKKTAQNEERCGWIGKRTVILWFAFFLTITSLLESCAKDPIVNDFNGSKNDCGTPYTLKLPNFFPPMTVPANNPFTVEGIELGRHLFYEKMLSGDNSQACADCHHQELAFTDSTRFSVGIDGFVGPRNAMPLANLAYSPKLFWDGKATTLEQSMNFPIQAQFEMHEDLFNAVSELQESEKYRGMFHQAFCDSTVTLDRMSKAMAQFLRTIISYNFKSAPGGVGSQSRNVLEERGFQVFLDEKKGDCFHCHSVSIFTTNFEFVNNGTFQPGGDIGRMSQTGNPEDQGKFKTPSLINLKYTAPYMHDGRFSTLRQVIDFYDTGFHVSPTLDPNIRKHADDQGKPIPRNWTEEDKQNLLLFLNGLKDENILDDPRFSNPN